MTTSNTIKAFIFTATIALGFSANAQCDEYKWPTDPALRSAAEEKNVLLDDAVKFKEYKKAFSALNWLLVNVPDLNKSIYIQGVEVLGALATKARQEKDAARMKIYVDSLLIVYDMRMKNCGETAEIVNRKANSAYSFKAQDAFRDPVKAKELLDLMDHAFELAGNDVFDQSLVPYMQVIQISSNKKHKLLSDEEVMKRYDKISEIIDYKIAKGGRNVARLKADKNKIDEIMSGTVQMTCEFINANWKPKYLANPSDTILAQKIFQYMTNAGCTDDPFWLQLGQTINSTKKDFGLEKALAIGYLKLDNIPKAKELFNEAAELAPDGQSKSDMYMYLGRIAAKAGNKPEARQQFLKAASADPKNKEAYKLIGDLYAGSFEECAQKADMPTDRLVFIAAYEMYFKAGDQQAMVEIKKNFPSVGEMFTNTWKIGDIKHVECWINVDVTLRARDK